MKYLIQKAKNLNQNIFPSINFIFLSEEEKVQYFKNNNLNEKSFTLNNFIFPQNVTINNNTYINSNQINNNNILFLRSNSIHKSNMNNFINEEKSKFFSTNNLIEININNSILPKDLYKIFKNSYKHILYAKPYFIPLKNINLQKLEYEYFIDDLTKNGIDIHTLLNDCLDPINNVLNSSKD